MENLRPSSDEWQCQLIPCSRPLPINPACQAPTRFFSSTPSSAELHIPCKSVPCFPVFRPLPFSYVLDLEEKGADAASDPGPAHLEEGLMLQDYHNMDEEAERTCLAISCLSLI